MEQQSALNNVDVPCFMRGIQKFLPNCLYSNFFWIMTSIKLSVTLFAFFVYARFSPFNDAEFYMSAPTGLTGVLPQRSILACYLYGSLRRMLYSDLAVHLLISLFLVYVIWTVFNKKYYFLNKPLFFSTLLLPHFMIWSGMVGKEALAIAGFSLLVLVCVNLLMERRIQWIALMMGLVLASFRPHYLIAYAYLFLLTWVLTVCSSTTLRFFSSTKNNYLLLSSLLLVTLFGLWMAWDNLAPHLLRLMDWTEGMFLKQNGHVHANRLDIAWSSPKDFIGNLWWGVPIGLIGPTLKEAITRPLLFPVFMEGCFALGLFVLILYQIIRFSSKNPVYSAAIILGFIPALLLGLLVNYPVGLFNPGSAIRYKQSLVPLLYFYPLLLMAAVNQKMSPQQQKITKGADLESI